MITRFDGLFRQVRNARRRRLVVPAAEGESIIKACHEALKKEICNTILIGSKDKIERIMNESGVEQDSFEIVNEKDPLIAVDKAIEMVRNGDADLLMKGKTDTPTLLKAVLDSEKGIKTGRTLSHVAVVEMDSYPRLMLMTDGGLNIRPDINIRKDIIRNAVDFAHHLGNKMPKVALLSATEKVNPKMEETVQYNQIVEEHNCNPFVEATIEGPTAMDIALNKEAARIKGIDSRIAGKTDVFVFPEIATCNISVKALIYLAGARASGIVLGAKVPVVLLSRADDAETKLRSIALGTIWE